MKQAPGGDRFLLHRFGGPAPGKLVFAEQCARCHSGKQPPATIADQASRIQWLRDAVLRDDFLDSNFLSDDQRYPVTEIGTNAARAVASNAIRGHIWDEFSSDTYKNLPSAGELRGLYNPLDPGAPLKFKLPGEGGAITARRPS